MAVQRVQRPQRAADKRIRVLMQTALVAGVAFGVTPALATTEYIGGGYITVDDNCAQFGWTGTQQVMVRLEPQGLRGNVANETQMALFLNTGTIALRLNLDRGIRYSYTPTQAVYIWNGPYAPAAPTMTLSFGIDADWPLQDLTLMDRLQVRISNFNEHEGCSAWLYASLAKN